MDIFSYLDSSAREDCYGRLLAIKFALQGIGIAKCLVTSSLRHGYADVRILFCTQKRNSRTRVLCRHVSAEAVTAASWLEAVISFFMDMVKCGGLVVDFRKF